MYYCNYTVSDQLHSDSFIHLRVLIKILLRINILKYLEVAWRSLIKCYLGGFQMSNTFISGASADGNIPAKNEFPSYCSTQVEPPLHENQWGFLIFYV